MQKQNSRISKEERKLSNGFVNLRGEVDNAQDELITKLTQCSTRQCSLASFGLHMASWIINICKVSFKELKKYSSCMHTHAHAHSYLCTYSLLHLLSWRHTHTPIHSLDSYLYSYSHAHPLFLNFKISSPISKHSCLSRQHNVHSYIFCY